MAKIKYTAKENTRMGTHSFYASPVFSGTLTTEEIVEEACANTSYEESMAKGIVEEVMKAIQRNLLKGFRCELGSQFITLYPNIKLSVTDKKDKTTGEVTEVATADMVKASLAESKLGCTVHAKFSKQFAQEVSWQKVDQSGAAVEDEDVTDDESDEDAQQNLNPEI